MEGQIEKIEVTIEEKKQLMALRQTGKRWNITRGVILSGWIMGMFTSMAILFAALYLMMTGKPLPDTLDKWATMVLGFLIGTFMAMVKDFIAKADS